MVWLERELASRWTAAKEASRRFVLLSQLREDLCTHLTLLFAAAQLTRLLSSDLKLKAFEFHKS